MNTRLPSREEASARLMPFAIVWTVVIGLAQATFSQTPDSFNPGASSSVLAMAMQSDGKALLGGTFTSLSGQARNRLGRLNADGTLDTGFNAPANATVFCLALQPDGRVLTGGDFTSLAGNSRTAIGRLNTNGSLDATFNMAITPPPAGYSQTVRVQGIVVQPDGKILVGGRSILTRIDGQTISSGFIRRLNTNGTSDATFTTTGGVGGPVTTLALQDDGKVLVGGTFTSLRGQTRFYIGRLNSDGTLDTDFIPGANGSLITLAVQADGKILVGGAFTQVSGQPRANLARLNRDGTPDLDFNPGVSGSGSAVVYSFAVQADGRIIIGGLFTTLAGLSCANVGRLNSDGTVDPGFNPRANSYVYALALQSDGKLLLGGEFNMLAAQPRSRIGRLNATEPATESLSDDGSTVTWLRGGSSPEAWRTTFEISTNLTNWSFLGEGSRIPGGWEIGGLPPSPDIRVRARAFVTGGGYNASGWFAETISGPCRLTSQPIGRTNNAGTTASFSVAVAGSPPFTYRWLKDGALVPYGGQITRPQSASLLLSNVLGADVGGYSVIVSNSFGSITSLVATLKVLDPFITSSLFTNSVNIGDTATVTASVAGTAPISYQWLKAGTNLPGATTTSLVLSNVQPSDVAIYAIAVSNAFGSAISNRMMLEVNLALADNFSPSLNGAVYGMAEQLDGKIIVGGAFTTVNGEFRPYLARLHPDGDLDTSFDPGTNITIGIYAMSALPDGRILVAGNFSITQSSQTRGRLVRLNSDGSLDSSFDPKPVGTVWALAHQMDGKIVIGGYFTSLGGQARSYIGRLNPDGTLDSGFNPGANSVVQSLAVQTDGKILAGGSFGLLGGQMHENIGRLNPDGSADSTFNPSANSSVNCVVVQADGGVLVGGYFTRLGNFGRKYIGRLVADGALDLFNPLAQYYANGKVDSLSLQADGGILVGGEFHGMGGGPRYYLARVLPTGQADSTFNSAIAHHQYVPLVYVGALANGNTLVAGSFTSLGGQPRTNLARLSATGPADAELTSDDSTLTWQRSGTCPEVNWACFEGSTNDTNWVKLGEGTRVAGGWRLDNVVPTAYTVLRARGFATGGYYSSSSWHVESRLIVGRLPRIVTDDGRFGFRTNRFGFSLSAASGQTIVVEASTNLNHWQPLETNTLDSGTFYFSDPGWTNRPAQFYRARLMP